MVYIANCQVKHLTGTFGDLTGTLGETHDRHVWVKHMTGTLCLMHT